MDKFLKVKKAFEENQDKQKSVKMAQYMRNQFLFYGLQTPERKLLYKDLLKDEKKAKQIDWEFLDQCYQDEHREFQYLVKDYLAQMKTFLTYDDIPKIFRFVKQKQWWDTIDGLDRIIGDIGLRDSRVDHLMVQWSMDQDFWVRRIAIDHQLTRKEKTNTALLEQILVNNLGSDEFFINKAIGWSLREYSKTNSQWVKHFINQHKQEMNKLSIREASKYLH